MLLFIAPREISAREDNGMNLWVVRFEFNSCPNFCMTWKLFQIQIPQLGLQLNEVVMPRGPTGKRLYYQSLLHGPCTLVLLL